MKYIFAVIISVFCSASIASVTSTSTGKIAGIRVEGTSGLISLSQHIADGNHVCSRVWVDLTKDYDRAAYSTFLMAFAAGKIVNVRAISQGSLRFGACDFYDVYISG